MVNIVIIDKNGDKKTQNIKFDGFDGLHKKCGFRTSKDFSKRMTWNLEYKNLKLCIGVFAKNAGKATTENKFDFPPPIDNDLYFGKIAIIACLNKFDEVNITDLTHTTWEKIYESLMGGFEDIENTDNEEESEEDIPEELRTAHGYKKDGFVVSDGEEESDPDYVEEDDHESDNMSEDDELKEEEYLNE